MPKKNKLISDNLAVELDLEGDDRDDAEDVVQAIVQFGKAMAYSFAAALSKDQVQIRAADAEWANFGIQVIRIASRD